ncbi:MAG: uroporphyrinogen decarboxylase family protein [candidate division KSB1 bacterium]|jgi:uroporphyrinogen decarboxylase|nr:uroporphyrinogen decarboxylase family protein [candidate division KSB1 bacterium]
MTSRERVLTTLRHEEPDKVPIDFGAMRSTGIMAIAYNALKTHLGISGGETRVYDIGQQLAEVEEPLLQRFEVDVIDLANTMGQTSDAWREWTLPDGSRGYVHDIFYPEREDNGWVIRDKGSIVARMPEGVLYFESVNPTLENAKTLKDIEAYQWHLYTDEDLKDLEQRARRLYEDTDYAIMGGFGGNILELGQALRGWSNLMMDLAMNQSFAEDLMDKMVEVHLKNLEGYLQAVGDYIQVIQMGDDLGTQHATQLSPDMYREMIKPRHKKIYQYVKSHSDLYVFLHSCGSIYDLIPDLIDAGVDILNPVQTSANKMDPSVLKDEFGDTITFWGGGVDTQHILPDGSTDDVRDDVEMRMRIFAPGGGFVFAPIHNVQANVPPENVATAFETVINTRDYENI